MRRWVTSISVAVALAAGLLAGAPAASGAVSYLFDVSARGGRISGIGADTGREHLTLTLTGVADVANQFADRPVRRAYAISTAELVRGWSTWFAKSSPNAILAYTLPGDPLPHNAVFVLSKPRYDRAKRTLTFEARHIHREVQLSPKAQKVLRDKPIWRAPASFSAASLFIDSVTTPGCTTDSFVPAAFSSCPGGDLRGLQLPYQSNLPRSNLAGADLTASSLVRAYLRYTDLSGADLTAADLTSADLAYAKLTNARLRNANLWGVYLAGADLTGADLRGVVSGNVGGPALAMPAGAAIVDNYIVGPGVNLAQANLAGANLSGLDLSGALLGSANLHGAILRQANLSGALLTATDLTGADLTGANLTGAHLYVTKLDGANLTGVNVEGADLQAAYIFSGVISSGVVGTPASLPSGWVLVGGVFQRQ